MSNLQVLIEKIRTAISFPETVPPDQMRIYARDYADSCTELNRRMLQCVQHIRSGNIAEGVRLAEMKPDLLEMFQSLDFTEREEWIDIVSTLGFDVPPPLPVDQSKELNDAYLKMSPLEPLLRWHRLHALNGSSIQERLAVLRAIAKADTENIFWAEDQEKFEKVRIKELEKEIKNAIATKNSLQIRVIYKELSSPDWIVPPSPEYRQTLCTSVLQDYAETLMQYFAAFNYPNAAEMYEKMQQLLAANAMAMPSVIQQMIRPALLWLNETQQQNKFQYEFSLCSTTLRNALETETPLPNLERLYYTLKTAASQAGTIIPAELEELYQSEISRLNSAVTTRNRLIIVSVVGTCLLVGGLIAYGLNQRLHTNRVQSALAALQKIETENLFEDITGIIQRIETETPDLAKIPDIAAAIERLRTMLKTDKDRAKDFERYHSQASTALDTPAKPSFSELRQIKISVDQAETLARSAQENILFSELKRKYDSALALQKREIDASYSEKLTKISDEFNALRRGSELSPVEILPRLRDIARQLEILQQKNDISAALKGQGKEVAEMIAAHQKKIEKELEQGKAFQNLVKLVSNFTAYKSALSDFVEKYPDHPAAGDAAEVLKELDAVKNVAVPLHDLSASYSKVADDFNELQKEASEFLDKFKELSSHLSKSGNTESATEVFPPGTFLETLSQIKPLTPESFKVTETLLKSLSQREVFPWIDDKGQWYYLTKKPDKAETYSYITTFVSEEKKFRIAENDFKHDKVLVGTQYQFAIAALKRIDEIKDNAAAIVCDLMESMIAANGIDPILKCVLLDSFISDMSKIDPFFTANFKRHYEVVQKSGVDLYTNWMDIGSKNTVPQRNLATAALERLPNIKELTEKMKKDQSQFKDSFKNFRPRFDWIGLLSKQNGVWSCLTNSNSLGSETGDIYILRLKADNTVFPVKIGNVSDAGIKLSSGESNNLQCLPVFLKK